MCKDHTWRNASLLIQPFHIVLYVIDRLWLFLLLMIFLHSEWGYSQPLFQWCIIHLPLVRQITVAFVHTNIILFHFSDNSAGFVPILNLTGEFGNFWLKQTVDSDLLPVYEVFQLVLEGRLGDGEFSDIAVDDFVFSPNCRWGKSY